MHEPNQSQPLVSIIIPNYNHARYVGDAIESVLAQTYRNVEIIVVDDGSTDNSLEVIGRFGDRVHCIHKKNAGLSAARNTGFAASKGDLIGVLDADDLYTPEALATLVSHLVEHPEADGVHCGYRCVDEHNRDLPHFEVRDIDSRALYEVLLDGNFLVPESMFLRRKVYEQVGLFDEALRACEDWDVWLRAAKSFRIDPCPRILVRYRVVPGSMSSDPLRMVTNRLTVLATHLGPEPAAPGASLAHRSFGRAYLTSCIDYLQYGSAERAYENFRSMANRCPSLLTEIDTFYKIACGDQPKGASGDAHSLDIEHGAELTSAMLKKLFSDPETDADVRLLESKAYATAHTSLGILAYSARQFQAARASFLRALSADPSLAFSRRVMAPYLKSQLGPGMIDFLKSLRKRTATNAESAC